MSKSNTKLRDARIVLIIDDEEGFCVFLSRMLVNWGYKVRTSNSARSVDFEQFGETDIIFIDIKMPDMSGIQVLEFLSQKQVKSSIVLMSGADIDDLSKAETLAKQYDLELIGVLDKPFRELDILTILETNR